ncbi:MAG: hypothetical protein KBT27_07230 [Prevotellaceae bacterium]|nr:hypothetical protein [Candidatus Faecinaster equi]
MKTNLMMGIGNGGCNVVRKIAEHDLESMSFYYYHGEDNITIDDVLQDTEKLILVACLGGMIGSEFVVKVATTAHEMSIPTTVVVTTPFAFEGSVRKKRALATLEKLQKVVKDIKICDNESIKDKYDDLNLLNAYDKSTEELINIILDCHFKEVVSLMLKA